LEAAAVVVEQVVATAAVAVALVDLEQAQVFL
jgi:hypothetical protein